MAKNSIPQDEALKPTAVVSDSPQDATERMKAALSVQPKKSIMIPRAKNDPKDAFETVQLNGYTIQITKGVYVEVPEQVAQIIMEAKKQTEEALAKAKNISSGEHLEFDNSK